VPLITEYAALHFLFPWYTLTGLEDKLFPEPSVSTGEILEIVETHYQNVSEHFGYSVLPNEQMVNGMGYQLLQMKKPEYAFAFFDLNLKNYPTHANVFDSMGDYYLAQADTLKAIEFFEKAVTLGDLSYSKDKLKTIRKNK
jgi:tetratricopeptide (TPR) repeat protein